MKPFKIMYQVPYNDCEWRVQWFSTLQEAMSMIDFYIYRMKKDNANQAAIDLYTKILKEVDSESL